MGICLRRDVIENRLFLMFKPEISSSFVIFSPSFPFPPLFHSLTSLFLFHNNNINNNSTFTDDNAKDGDLYIRAVSISPDNKYLAAGTEDRSIKLFDINTNRFLFCFIISLSSIDIYLHFSLSAQNLSHFTESYTLLWAIAWIFIP